MSTVIAAPTATPVEEVTPIKPSEALRLGILLRPRQVAGRRFDGEDGACATGAMLVGGGLGEEATANLHWDRWPGLVEMRIHPPMKCHLVKPRKKYVTGFLVEHLNDGSHGWSRERIADWLEGLGL